MAKKSIFASLAKKHGMEVKTIHGLGGFGGKAEMTLPDHVNAWGVFLDQVMSYNETLLDFMQRSVAKKIKNSNERIETARDEMNRTVPTSWVSDVRLLVGWKKNEGCFAILLRRQGVTIEADGQKHIWAKGVSPEAGLKKCIDTVSSLAEFMRNGDMNAEVASWMQKKSKNAAAAAKKLEVKAEKKRKQRQEGGG